MLVITALYLAAGFDNRQPIPVDQRVGSRALVQLAEDHLHSRRVSHVS
jgi:hypothetical protein